jgi:Family of unknown function (DUF6325)
MFDIPLYSSRALTVCLLSSSVLVFLSRKTPKEAIMSLGPVEMLVVRFPGDHFTGDIVPALRQLVDSGIVRIIDIAFVHKDANGKVQPVELDDLAPDEYINFDPMVGEITGIFSPADFEELSRQLENNASAAFLLFENTWATRFRDSVLNAGGEIVLIERIPKQTIDELLADQANTAGMPMTSPVESTIEPPQI